MKNKIELTPESAAELLAVCYVYGNENFSKNRRLFEATMEAKKLFNITGGAEITLLVFTAFTEKLEELKNPELVKKYPEAGSLMQCYTLQEAIQAVEWVRLIDQEFGGIA